MKQSNDNQIGQAVRYSPIIKYILDHNPKEILEIGSGSQGIGRFLNINFDGLDLTSSDYGIDENEIYKGMNFIKGSALDMPIDDNIYDFVYSCDMLEHIRKDNREKAINEAIRVCRNGGCIIFCFPCGFIARLFDFLLKLFYELLSIFCKRIQVPGWLEEHMEIEYPNEAEIRKIIKNLEKVNKKISYYNADNIFYWAIITFIDMTKFFRLKNKIIDSYVKRPKLGKTIFPYRKYLIIHK